MLAFVRAPSPFSGAPAELFVQRLPDGELVQLTSDGLTKANPKFSPDGTRIAYTTTVDGGAIAGHLRIIQLTAVRRGRS